MLRILLPASALAVMLSGAPALAHLDPATHGSFMAGATHPVFGADHVLAMVAVGLWAVLLGGSALCRLPLAFVGAMAAGFALAMTGVALPFVEPMILASVLALGVAVALAVRLPQVTALAAVAAFGLFHGHAHGGEIGAATALAYLAGFTLATAALHGAGVLAGLALLRADVAARTVRALGGLTALAGLGLGVAG